MPYPHVFSPITINGLEIKNRIIRSAHGTGLSAGGLQVLIDYHEARAKGGVGLTILEVASVHPTCASSILAFRPEVVSDYEQLVEASHRHGMKLFQQLWHAGNNAMTLTGGPPWAPSRVMGAQATVLPLPMTKGMIDEVVEGYARAARHCKQGGLDGVEIHGAHGYLLTQFMSPVTNLREDGYGGSFENRMRFPREVIAAIRSEVGDDYPLGIRLTASEGVTNGIGPQENLEIALALEDDGVLDFYDVSVGSYYSFDQFIGGMHEPHGYELERSTVATKALTKPTIVTGRVITIAEAEEIISSGRRTWSRWCGRRSRTRTSCARRRRGARRTHDPASAATRAASGDGRGRSCASAARSTWAPARKASSATTTSSPRRNRSGSTWWAAGPRGWRRRGWRRYAATR